METPRIAQRLGHLVDRNPGLSRGQSSQPWCIAQLDEKLHQQRVDTFRQLHPMLAPHLVVVANAASSAGDSCADVAKTLMSTSIFLRHGFRRGAPATISASDGTEAAPPVSWQHKGQRLHLEIILNGCAIGRYDSSTDAVAPIIGSPCGCQRPKL